jgi:integrative and conjugative element protein (TIGR02256 family)
MTALLRVAPLAVATITREAAISADGKETGGILLGFEQGELGEALATEAGGPGPKAERRRDFFRRDLDHAQELAADAYRRTTARWIGEWHTHPRGALLPSAVDLRTYRGFLRDRDLDFQVFLALIVGPGEEGWRKPQAAAWLIEPRRILPGVFRPSRQLIEVVLGREASASGASYA